MKKHFVQVVSANQGIVKSLCRAFHHRGEDQKDAYQDIILQLWKSFDSFRGESQISTWIYRVSLNTLLSKVRQDKNRIVTEPLSVEVQHIPHALADGDRELLNMVLQSLKDVDKAIVILFLEGYKNKEISKMLDITPSNVSSRLNRVKDTLKARFKNCQYAFE